MATHHDMNNLYKEKLSDRDFQRLGRFIEAEFGIKMPPGKREMLESRLRKRLKILNMQTYTQYTEYLFSPEGMRDEILHMIDAVSTNKTDFFREPEHFDILVKHILPEMVAVNGAGIKRELMIWSAGCSTGEEPYTLAMALSEFKTLAPGLEFHFTILATDVSFRVLDSAKRAVYTEERTNPIPNHFLHKYLMRSKDHSKKLMRIVPELRTHVRFRHLNLLDPDFGMRSPFDIIFYRNVMIYFNRDLQQEVLKKVVSNLRPGGYIFIGHSETLTKFDLPVHQVYPTVYRKDA